MKGGVGVEGLGVIKKSKNEKVGKGEKIGHRPKSYTKSYTISYTIWYESYLLRSFPRKNLVKGAEEMRWARVSESRRRGADPLKRHRVAAAERQQEYTMSYAYTT